MVARYVSLAFCLPALFHLGEPASAQEGLGWGTQVDGLAVYQGKTDLDSGGSFSATRAFVRGSARYNFGDGFSAGFSLSLGQFDYDFDNVTTQPWTDIRDIRISLPVSFRLSDSATAIVAPGVRWDYQSGVSADDGRTYGVFAGIAWKVSPSLTIGPAFGAYTQLEKSGTDFFPALLVDWDISERLNLSTGTGLGATSGPGLTLGYKFGDASTIALTARSERVRFRLDDQGLAPSGVGEDRSVPVVVSYTYSPNPGVSLNAFAGAEFGGRLTLDNASGSEVLRQDYDTAPIVGVAARLRF